MTEIRYYRTKNGFELEATGHAGYAQKGMDIVCSAVSTLTQTLLYRVMDLTIMYDFNISDGNLYLAAEGDVMESFCTILTGLNLLESAFPDYVKVVAMGCPIKQSPENISFNHKGRDLPQI